MALWGKKKNTSVLRGDGPKDTVDKWSSIPNASVGKSVEKSIKQVIRDGGVKGHSAPYKRKGKDIGMEITTKNGKRTQIKDLVAVKNTKKRKGKK